MIARPLFRIVMSMSICWSAIPAAADITAAPERLTLKGDLDAAPPEQCERLSALKRYWMQDVTLHRTFLDDFDRFDLTDGIWTPHYNHNKYPDWRARTLTGNEEEQIYVDPGYAGEADAALGLNPFRVENGVLKITAEPVDARHLQALRGYRYQSGVITSRASHLQTYGYFEIRARVPRGQGLWPAFWMLRPGMWPPEIDVIETLGHDPEQIEMHVHWNDPDGKHQSEGCEVRVPTATQQFHTYGVLWTPEAIVRFIDRKPVAASPTRAELDGPMYMIANLAVGGKWPGSPDPSTPFPAAFEIDWIAAWQLDDIGKGTDQ